MSRYEDLVQDPKGEVARIAQGLGVESPSRPSYQTIFHDLDKTTWGGNPSKKGLETPKEVVANLQDLNQYDEILTQRELDLISLKTGSYLEMLGYERSSSATRLRVVLSYIALDRWEWINWSNPKEVLRGLYGSSIDGYDCFNDLVSIQLVRLTNSDYTRYLFVPILKVVLSLLAVVPLTTYYLTPKISVFTR